MRRHAAGERPRVGRGRPRDEWGAPAAGRVVGRPALPGRRPENAVRDRPAFFWQAVRRREHPVAAPARGQGRRPGAARLARRAHSLADRRVGRRGRRRRCRRGRQPAGAGNSDLDLHLVPTGNSMWGCNDCFFCNPAPPWSVHGWGLPVYALDNTYGYGPENINVKRSSSDGDLRLCRHQDFR